MQKRQKCKKKSLIALSCKAVSCVINLLRSSGTDEMAFRMDQLGSCQCSVQKTANLGPFGLPFGVHGTAIWGPWDCRLGSMGLLFGVHVTAIWGLWDCHLESWDCHWDPMWLPYEGNSTAVLWFLGKPFLCSIVLVPSGQVLAVDSLEVTLKEFCFRIGISFINAWY